MGLMQFVVIARFDCAVLTVSARFAFLVSLFPFQRYWRKVLHEDHDKISLKGLVPVSVISIPRSDTSARSHIIARSRVTEIVGDLEDVTNEPEEEEPPIAIIIKEVAMGNEPRSMTSHKSYSSSTSRPHSRRRSSRAVSPSGSVDPELLENVMSNSTQVSSATSSRTVNSPPRSAGKLPKSNPKYITRVKGASSEPIAFLSTVY